MSTYSPSLRIELITSGTQPGTWGDTTNNNFASIVDAAIGGYQTVAASGSQALTYTNGPASTAAGNTSIYAMLRFTASAVFTIYAPPVSKMYVVWNDSIYAMTLRVSDVIGSTTAKSGNVALTIAAGAKVLVWSDNTSFYDIQTTGFVGTLPIANGGTNSTATPTNGGITYGTGTAQAYSAAGTSGQVLRSNGAAAPTWIAQSSIAAGSATNAGLAATALNAILADSATTASSVSSALTAGTGLTATATYNGSAAITFNATGTTISSKTSAYVLVAADAGKTISITTGGVTIPNATMSAGDIISIYNNSGSSQTITQGTSLTLQWAGQAVSLTGNRTLGLYGLCTIVFISSSNAVISGSGLT